MLNRTNLYIDFDDVIATTSKNFVEYTSSLFDVEANYDKLADWNFRNLFPFLTREKMYEIFESEEFINSLTPNKGVKKYLQELSRFCNLNIVTFGTKENLKYKYSYVTDNFVVESPICFVGIEEEKHKTKSVVDMADGVFIDDRVDNLLSTNAKIKILLKNYRDFEWNQLPSNTDIVVCNSWEEIYDCVTFYHQYQQQF